MNRRPIAQRTLAWTAGNGAGDVVIRVWSPVRFDGGFVCDYAIDGLPDPVRSYANGVDSLQALQIALRVIQLTLKPYRERLRLNDMGGIGIGYTFDLAEHPNEQSRLEQLVENEIEQFLKRENATGTRRYERWKMRMRRKYGSDTAALDLDTLPVDEIIERLRAASAREAALRSEGNDDAAWFFTERVPLITALAKRPDWPTTIAQLLELDNEGDQPLRLQAAMLCGVGPDRIAELERLRDENVGPEAQQARRMLRVLYKDAKRRRPWDNDAAT